MKSGLCRGPPTWNCLQKEGLCILQAISRHLLYCFNSLLFQFKAHTTFQILNPCTAILYHCCGPEFTFSQSYPEQSSGKYFGTHGAEALGPSASHAAEAPSPRVPGNSLWEFKLLWPILSWPTFFLWRIYPPLDWSFPSTILHLQLSASIELILIQEWWQHISVVARTCS